MSRLFADAGYWIALLNPKDGLHGKAVEVSKAVGHVRIVTTEMVLAEVLNAFAGKGEILRGVACSLVAKIRSNPNADIVPMTDGTFQSGLTRYCSRGDKAWGLTDCVSFLIMEANGMTDALSADRDFQQAGFRALLLE